MDTFKNENFTVEATKEQGCRLSLKVFVHPDQAKRIHKKAIKLVNKKISVPGFRKGKAPDATVLSRYGSYVDQEYKELLVNEAYRAALDLTEIYPLNKNSIRRLNIENCSEKEGATILISYEFYPDVPEIDFSGMTLPEMEKEPLKEEKIEGVIEEVKKAHANFEDLTEKAIEKEDFVEISIDAIDTDPPKPIINRRRLEVNEKRIAPWLIDLLIGKKPGEIVEGTSKGEEAKSTKVQITIHAIKKMILPELTDELAKKVGADSVKDMKQKIRINLEREAEEHLRQKQIEALDKLLLEKYVFDLPASIFEDEKTDRLRSRLQNLKNEGISDEEMKSKSQEIETEITKEVDAILRLYFIHKQIAKQGNISVTTEELNEEILKQIPYLPEKEISKELLSRITAALLEKKTKEYALNQLKSLDPGLLSS